MIFHGEHSVKTIATIRVLVAGGGKRAREWRQVDFTRYLDAIRCGAKNTGGLISETQAFIGPVRLDNLGGFSPP